MTSETVLCLDLAPRVQEALGHSIGDAGYRVVPGTRRSLGRSFEEAGVVVADLRAPGPPLPALQGRVLVALVGRGTPTPPEAVEALVDPGLEDADLVLAAAIRALARHRLAVLRSSMKETLRSLATEVRAAELAYDRGGATGAADHVARIRDALGRLEQGVRAIEAGAGAGGTGRPRPPEDVSTN